MLPEVELRKPTRIVGRDTIECMQSGIFYGIIGQLEGIVRRMWNEIGSECRVICTGGHCELVRDELTFDAAFDPYLTLKGIAYSVDKSLRRPR